MFQILGDLMWRRRAGSASGVPDQRHSWRSPWPGLRRSLSDELTRLWPALAGGWAAS